MGRGWFPASLQEIRQKSILTNMNVEKGKSMLDFYFDMNQNALVLKLSKNQEVENGRKG